MKFIILLIIMSSHCSYASIKRETILSFDKFPLSTEIILPSPLVKKVVIFLHGSGPQDLNQKLTHMSQGQDNLMFRDIALKLEEGGIGSVRFNKRSYELLHNHQLKEKFESQFNKNPLKYIIEDASFIVSETKKKFPKSKIILLGHSEGTKIALNVTRTQTVDGVVLIGFYNQTLQNLLFEQVVYRSLNEFDRLDRNKNQFIEKYESYEKHKKLFKHFDIDKDKKISITEYKTAHYIQLLDMDNEFLDNYTRNETDLPQSSSIIKNLEIPLLFLQGEYDNQTPSYYTHSIEKLNDVKWTKKNLNFIYLKGRGHALDRRRSPSDLRYTPLDEEILSFLQKEISEL